MVPVIKKTLVWSGITLVVVLLFVGANMIIPTARVVDAETGEPVEGAVYLATWWKQVSGKKAWFEGPSIEMAKFVEGHSDTEGKIFVPWYWFKIPLFGNDRTLTVYKPGYVMWNSEWVFPDMSQQSSFNRSNREVRLARWGENHLHIDHEIFLINVSNGRIDSNFYMMGKQLLKRSFHDNEFNLSLEEMKKRSSSKK